MHSNITGEQLIVTANHVASCHNSSVTVRQIFINQTDYMFPRGHPMWNQVEATPYEATVVVFSVKDDYCLLRLPKEVPVIPSLVGALDYYRGKARSYLVVFAHYLIHSPSLLPPTLNTS